MKPQDRTRAILRSGLKPLERLLLIAICDYASGHGEAWPSILTLVNDTGMGRRTIIRTLKALDGRGLKISKARGRSSVYRFDPDSLPKQCQGVPERHQCQSGTSARAARGWCQSGTSARAAPVPERHGGGARAARGVVPERHGGGARAAPEATNKRPTEATKEATNTHGPLSDPGPVEGTDPVPSQAKGPESVPSSQHSAVVSESATTAPGTPQPETPAETAARLLAEHKARGEGGRPPAFMAGLRGEDKPPGPVQAALWELGHAELQELIAAGVVKARPAPSQEKPPAGRKASKADIEAEQGLEMLRSVRAELHERSMGKKPRGTAWAKGKSRAAMLKKVKRFLGEVKAEELGKPLSALQALARWAYLAPGAGWLRDRGGEPLDLMLGGPAGDPSSRMRRAREALDWHEGGESDRPAAGRGSSSGGGFLAGLDFGLDTEPEEPPRQVLNPEVEPPEAPPSPDFYPFEHPV